MTAFHVEQWNPSWSVSTMLTGLLSFMVSPCLQDSNANNANMAGFHTDITLADMTRGLTFFSSPLFSFSFFFPFFFFDGTGNWGRLGGIF